MIHADAAVYQAKSFYNAYIALEQLDQTNDHLLYRVPMFVNGAFSIELALKAILANNQIDYKKKHHILVLFQMLPDSFKSELLDHLIEKAPEYGDSQKCADELILISNAFVDWRYCFEGKPAPAFDARFLSAFANAAVWTMMSHYNVDLVLSSSKDKTDDEIEEMIQKNREACIDHNLNYIQKNKENRK